jgi:hypothetical protein
MSVANDNNLKIREILSPIFGKEAWGTDLGTGSFLTIEFGRPVKTENKSTRLHGEWNIWLYGCGWRLEQGDCVLVGSEDRREKIASVIEVLNGQKLRDVKINGPAFDTTFLFENDLRICTFQLYTEEMESWYFYLPDHFVLIIGPGTGYEYTRSD